MKIGLHCPEVPGHLNPMTTLGCELQRRGHEVTFLGCQMAESIVQRSGLPFYALGPDDLLNDRLEQTFRDLGKTSGIQGMMTTGKIFGIQSKIVRQYIGQAFDEFPCDGLVIDQVSPAAALEAESAAIPYTVACNALAVYWDPFMPPPPLPWDYRTDLYGRVRNEVAKHLVLWAYRLLAAEKKVGVDPLKLIRGNDQALLHLAQQPAFFEYPRTKYPERLHYTGPWHRSERDDTTIEFPWDWLDGRPLIYASMGTLQNAVSHVFGNIIEAVRDLPMQIVLSKGGGQVDVPGPIPDNVLVVETAPQLRLLEKARMVITHAGMNTALECLSHGIPMLCLPVTNDQPGVAKRAEYLGNGRVIPVRQVTTARLRAELDRMLSDNSFQQKADQFAQNLASYDGLEMAAKLIEQALESRSPVLNPEHVQRNKKS
ncbi:glycosyl transferase family 1 [Blastopirellula marina]|uniref:Glycosyl transferase family 1 n=1 Tax=Blastopirellula marina TaxID=124 RepID=A0A2S8FXW0_9BACT|nr:MULTISPECIES: nucleotide disphospho-sugar-binding domain-containing protein [Pirellulaceae]PQO37008.1 glycosyl transferase family 1 [Blastopirellula marina]RCS53723.1 glycosyltransferase [Bremerella cremea]